MTVIYESIITKIGGEVNTFIDEDMMIIFNDTVPDELKSISVIHKQEEILQDIEVGDYFQINGERFQILCVGEKVNETLKELGHCTIKFSDSGGPELPGTLCVEKRSIPKLAENMTLKFIKQ